MKKIQFDLERSKKESKPYDGAGVQYIDRRLVNLSDIIYNGNENSLKIRPFTTGRTKVNNLKESISHRYDYTKPVMVCELGLDNNCLLYTSPSPRDCQ